MTEKQKMVNAFLRKIAKSEGLKHQASIGDIREIYKLMDKALAGALSDLVYTTSIKKSK